jgi:hypothetical protein
VGREERTAASASAIIDLDLSFSLLSWAERAISDERRRRFSTLSAEICALSSSIFTLRVEFNLGEAGSDVVSGGGSLEAYFVMCLLASRNRFLTGWGGQTWCGQQGFISSQFSNSKRASFCRMLMETRDSLLLIVPWPAVRVSFGSLVVGWWARPG